MILSHIVLSKTPLVGMLLAAQGHKELKSKDLRPDKAISSFSTQLALSVDLKKKALKNISDYKHHSSSFAKSFLVSLHCISRIFR